MAKTKKIIEFSEARKETQWLPELLGMPRPYGMCRAVDRFKNRNLSKR